MGLFSKKKTYVAATTLSLIEDTPNLVKDSVTTSILKGRDIGPDIVGNYLNGIYVQSRKYYSYGEKEYYYGLPDGEAVPIKTNDIAVTKIIEDEVGESVAIVSSVVSICDAYYFAIPWLRDNRGYNDEDGSLSNPPAGSVGDVYFVSADTLRRNYIKINYKDHRGAFSEEVYIPDVYPDAYYYHIVYIKQEPESPTYFWNYRPDSGVYPVLNLDATKDLKSPYYPVVPIRQYNKDVVKGDAAYPTTKKLLDKLSLDLDEVVEAINENPDQADIDHAYIIMGVDISSDKPQTIRYLHDYFQYLYGLNPWSKMQYDSWEATQKDGYQAPRMNTVRIKDASYTVDLNYAYIVSEVKTGTLTEEYEREFVDRPTYNSQYYAIEQSEMIFRKRLDADTYSEVRVVGLLHVNYVYSDAHTVDTTVAEAFARDADGEQTNGNFVIPLNYNVVESMGLMDANELLYDGIKIVFNSYETVKLKWYQTSFFQFLTIIVAIAVTVLTYQPGALTASIVGASTVVGLSTLALVMADLAVMFAIKKTFELVGEILPPNLVFALSFAFAAYAAGSLMATGSLQGLPFASDVLFAANNLASVSSEAAMNELNQEIEEFTLEAEAKQKELDELWEELETKVDLDPMDLFTSFGQDQYFETPGAYLHRSVHAGNVGAETLDSINHYVENQLTLPSLGNDLGVNINV